MGQLRRRPPRQLFSSAGRSAPSTKPKRNPPKKCKSFCPVELFFSPPSSSNIIPNPNPCKPQAALFQEPLPESKYPRIATLDCDQILQRAFELEFNPPTALHVVDKKLPTILFSNLTVLLEAFLGRPPNAIHNPLVKACGTRRITKRLIERIGNLLEWGPRGFSTMLRMIQEFQANGEARVAFIDDEVYSALVDCYWKMVRHGFNGSSLRLFEVGWMSNYLLGTIMM